ncbi:hypothetical protein GBAR_LOCUS17535 [Geodia barretti]|uniref:Uncharacterized protein n=1 Tax=Geodia barretti TaxID=519541 RepID=A0AA35SIV7_GEOBA|nr:hypothetical protein GBAR_LOCUS17535 [Geodia barretti]
MNKKGWVGKVLLVLAVMLPIGGMAFSVYLSTSGTSWSPFGKQQSGDESEYVLTSEDFPTAELDIGNQVGSQIPDFTLTLADGSAVTSAGLVEEGRPTYLFFWATI